ncbi:MAG: DUF983 domain-containing protein, partial [Phaeodactylibacter sp.]|nr:DUF983 domain-containing protein [Phaeodactylibacter sp.]
IFMWLFCIRFIAIFHCVLCWSTPASFALFIAFVAVFFVYIFRLARSIWLNINFKYDPGKT